MVIKATAADTELTSRLESLLALGDPDGEVAFAYSVKEAVAAFSMKPQIPRPPADLFRDIIDHTFEACGSP